MDTTSLEVAIAIRRLFVRLNTLNVTLALGAWVGHAVSFGARRNNVIY